MNLRHNNLSTSLLVGALLGSAYSGMEHDVSVAFTTGHTPKIPEYELEKCADERRRKAIAKRIRREKRKNKI